MSQNRSPSEEEVWDVFEGRCPKCRRGGRTIHELEPRSRGKLALKMINRTVICFQHHEEFHRNGASQSQIQEWKEYIKDYLESIGAYDKYVNWDQEHAEDIQ